MMVLVYVKPPFNTYFHVDLWKSGLFFESTFTFSFFAKLEEEHSREDTEKIPRI